jgi:hypothetical protein
LNQCSQFRVRFGRPPFLLFRRDCSHRKYSEPRSAVLLPPTRPACATTSLSGINFPQ